LLATLLLSQGAPMIMAGDEFGRTQAGNNNAYCQDNAISWIDWAHEDDEREMVAFVKDLVRLRLEHPVFRRTSFLEGVVHPDSSLKDVTWLVESGTEMQEADWHDVTRQSLGILLDRSGVGKTRSHPVDATQVGDSFLLLFNAGSDDKEFRIPASVSGGTWELVFDTDEEGGSTHRQGRDAGQAYIVQGRSMALFVDRDRDGSAA
jgi:glycogen operon protein